MDTICVTDGPGVRSLVGTAGRRGDILRAALASFAKHGFERASLRDIAARAGMSHVGLLHHFRDKHELLFAAIDDYETHVRRAVHLAAGEDAVSVALELLQVAMRQPDFIRAWNALRLAATVPTHPAHDFFADRQARLLAELTERLESTGAASGTGADAESAATLLLAVTYGLQVLSLTDPEHDITTPLRQLQSFLYPRTPPA